MNDTEPGDGRYYPSRPWVGVGVVVWKGDEVLLVRRGRPPRQGEWGIPGGAQELGETIFETAKREVAEETGVTIRPLSVLTALDGIQRDPAGRVEFHYTLIEVVAEWVSGEASPRSDVEAVCWMAPSEASKLVAWDATLRVLADAERQR